MPRARSVAELLPQRFEALSLRDIETILEEAEDESLYLEWKSDPDPRGIAKSCAAFANAQGGLFIIGVDKARKMVGLENPPKEAQVWIKDILRSHVLPMPSFRARELPLDDDRSLLLVLLEESSTTPHLQAHTGVIYVRNPGSSDPVPINDQARLIELLRRGRESREVAEQRAVEIASHNFHRRIFYTLSLCPTGASSDAVRDLYESPDLRDELVAALGALYEVRQAKWDTETYLDLSWSLRTVSLSRMVDRHLTHRYRFADHVAVHSDCGIQFQRCLSELDETESPAELRGIEIDGDILPWFNRALSYGREMVTLLGGHGDARLLFCVHSSQRPVYLSGGMYKSGPTVRDVLLAFWVPLYSDTAIDVSLEREVKTGLLRALGIEPF